MQRNIDSKYRVPVIREVSHLKTNVRYTYRFCYVKIHCMLPYLYLYDLYNINNKHLLFLIRQNLLTGHWNRTLCMCLIQINFGL
jgi:hypothetical protein